jgi:hypothetical protein
VESNWRQLDILLQFHSKIRVILYRKFCRNFYARIRCVPIDAQQQTDALI